MPSLVLLGDSILDNAPYTDPGADTTTLLRELLPGWSVTLLARDGATMPDVPAQLRQLRERASLAVLSVGGNDALRHAGLLDMQASHAAEVLADLLAIADDFEDHYRSLARLLRPHAERVVLCTIYEVMLEPARHARLARVPLAVLDDRIIRTASSLACDVLELRSVCTAADDFVLQIEPSSRGAAKIARAIAALATGAPALASARLFASGDVG
jgi:hypothetical protein